MRYCLYAQSDSCERHLSPTSSNLSESTREALAGLSEKTQFIVVTHNRGTIEAADTIYGVTMGDDGASRVLSLRLEEVGEG